MAKRTLPRLPQTGRRYLEGTVRARLRNPGIVRYRRAPGRGRTVMIAATLLAALLATFTWLASSAR
jgi:hypothetical protein